MRAIFSTILILVLWLGVILIEGNVQAQTNGTITAMVWHPTNNWIALGYEDGTVKVWDADNHTFSHIFTEPLTANILEVKWSADGTLLGATGYDEVGTDVVIWDVINNPSQYVRVATDAIILSIVLDSLNQHVYGVSPGPNSPYTIHKWNSTTTDTIVEISAGAYTDITFSNNGALIALSNYGGIVIREANQLDRVAGAVAQYTGIEAATWSTKWNAADTQILTGQADGNVILWSFNNSILAFETTFLANNSPFGWDESVVRDVAFMAGDTQIAAISADGTIRVWDITGGLLADVQLGNSISAAAFNPSGDTLAYSSPNDDTIITMETPSTTITCDTTIVAGDVTGLISAIDSADNTPEADTICLEAGTYTLPGVNNSSNGDNGLPQITTDITLVGLDAGATLYRDGTAAAFRHVLVGGTGHLTLHNVVLVGIDISDEN